MADGSGNFSLGVTDSRNSTKRLAEVLSQLTSFYLAFVIVIGLLGNFYCVVLFSSKGLRRLSSSQYLLALALADSGFLSSLLISWLRTWEVNLDDIKFICVFFTYLSSICAFLSEWSIFAFTAERFFAVSYPLRQKFFCTVSRARKVVVSLAIVSVVYNSWVPLTLDLQNGGPNSSFVCGLTQPDLDHIYKVMNLADTFVSFVVPAAFAFMLNCGIAVKLWRFAAIRHRLTSRQASMMSSVRQKLHLNKTVDGRDLRMKPKDFHSRRQQHPYESCSDGTEKRPTARRQTNPNAPRHNKKELRITRTLMTVAIVNLLLNLPSYIHRIAEVNRVDSSLVLEFLSYCLFYTQFCINFVLYSLQGRFKDVRSSANRTSVASRRLSNGSTKV